MRDTNSLRRTFSNDGYRCAQPILHAVNPSRVGWVERSDTHRLVRRETYSTFYSLPGVPSHRRLAVRTVRTILASIEGPIYDHAVS